MSSKSASNWVLVVVAIIGTVGTVTAAFIRTWDRSGTAGAKEIEQTITDNSPDKIDLSGTWYMQTTIEETTYNPYRGLVIQYKILLTHEEKSITANGNKIGEVFRGEASEYSGAAKTPISLTGSLSQDGSGQIIVKLNGQEESVKRKSCATSFRLTMLDHTRMIGTFSSTAANSKGTAFWISEDEWQMSGWNKQ